MSRQRFRLVVEVDLHPDDAGLTADDVADVIDNRLTDDGRYGLPFIGTNSGRILYIAAGEDQEQP